MQEIHVYPLPSMAEKSVVENSVAVVIDVLRATTVVAYAMNSGVKEIFPMLDIEEAFRLKEKIECQAPASVLLGGERKGLPIKGFDLGNSPQDYTPERVGGKTLVFTTTNGTVAMHAARSARRIYTAAFVNAAAVIDRIAKEKRIAIFCAGTNGLETEEDVLLAGCLVCRLCKLDGTSNGIENRTLNVSAETARQCWGSRESIPDAELADRLRQSRGGHNLAAIGLDADIFAAARRDAFDVVPELAPSTMRIR